MHGKQHRPVAQLHEKATSLMFFLRLSCRRRTVPDLHDGIDNMIVNERPWVRGSCARHPEVEAKIFPPIERAVGILWLAEVCCVGRALRLAGQSVVAES